MTSKSKKKVNVVEDSDMDGSGMFFHFEIFNGY